MKYFISIVDNNSFTEAAYENNISQSAISQQIKMLENELGTQLFIRKNRSFELTPAGDYFYRHGKALLEEFEQIKQETKRRGEDDELFLSIGYPQKYEGEELQDTIMEFSSIYPDVKISFVSGDHEELFQQLITHKIDMKLSEQRRMFNNDYNNYELKKAGCYIEISSKDELNTREKIDISDLKGKSCILVCSKEQRQEETKFYAETLKIADRFLYVDSISQARMMVISGRGFLVVDEIGKLPPTKSGIQRIPIYNGNEKIERNYFFCWTKDHSNYYIEEFANLFKKNLNK